METELKLRVSPAAVKRLTSHPLLKNGTRSTVQKLQSVYYDTPELDLWRNGAALRVRRDGTNWVQTVKWAARPAAGLHVRNELEMPVSGPAPDCTKLVHPDIDALFRMPRLAAALEPVFETDVTRSTRLIHMDGDVLIEASLDRGQIRSGERTEPLSELELELKRGAAGALFRAGLEIVARAPVTLESRSKAERGYALYRGTLPAPLKAGMPALDGEMTVSDAFATIAWATLRHLQGNEHGVLANTDPEFLHQMRVALRRLRSALSAFASALPEPARHPIAEELRWLGAALGPARDWDVFLTETLPPIRAAYPDRAALSALGEQCARLRAAAHREARRVLRSRRYQRIMVGLASWLATQAWREHIQNGKAAALDMPVRLYAQAELERRYERVRKRGRRLEALAAEDLHALRIAIKKLRYSVDFFAALFDPEPVRGLRARLSRLQDVLGTLNDSATLPRLLESFADDTGGAAAAEARGLLLGWSAGRADALRGDLNRAWKAFRRSETFW